MKNIDALTNKELDKVLDGLFSVFIRLRDSNDGAVQCISCGKIKHWSETDNGHYVSRSNKRLKYNETNCNAQCKHCNIFLKGNYTNYVQGLEAKYGIEKRFELDTLAKLGVFKTTRFYYLELILRYYDKLQDVPDFQTWFKTYRFKSYVLKIVEKYKNIIK